MSLTAALPNAKCGRKIRQAEANRALRLAQKSSRTVRHSNFFRFFRNAKFDVLLMRKRLHVLVHGTLLQLHAAGCKSKSAFSHRFAFKYGRMHTIECSARAPRLSSLTARTDSSNACRAYDPSTQWCITSAVKLHSEATYGR